MCGIAGLVFNPQQTYNGAASLDELFDLIIQTERQPFVSDQLLNFAWCFKTNASFVAYCRSKTYRLECKKAAKRNTKLANFLRRGLSVVDQSKPEEKNRATVTQIEQLLDAAWFLSFELETWRESVQNLSALTIDEVSDSSIAALLCVHKVISSIDNRLELRGRDSLGLTAMLNSATFSGKEVITNSDTESPVKCQFSSKNGFGSYLFTFRYFSNIGELGQNAEAIRALIRESTIFQRLICDKNLDSMTMIAHTRWASVGAIDLYNTLPLTCELISNHPDNNLVSTTLNGDIYNHKVLLEEFSKTESSAQILATRCSSDALAIPFAMDTIREPNHLLRSAKLISLLSGSFVIGLQQSSTSNALNLIKKGTQGLYLGFSEDSVIFASDIYGLVETTPYFYPITSDMSVTLFADKFHSLNNLDVEVYDHKKDELVKLSRDDISQTTITTRDISKIGYDHFLQKEIAETPDIVDKTLSLYVNEKTLDILIDEDQVPGSITDAIVSGKIKKIILTGMGTCYTAAVVISYFMRARLKSVCGDLLVEPHVATEGSGFYLENSMQDTLVIVVAQSGTTVDTNVFAQMAKERGAKTIALANKRDGDVTFLVDGCLYIGNGRDIEIAVPSTKTFTAHVVLGYILTLYFFRKFLQEPTHRELFNTDLRQILEIETIVQESLKTLSNKSLYSQVFKQAQSSKSWVVIYDESSNSSCAQEVRIKLSESCYQSVGLLTFNEALQLNLQRSFILAISEKTSAEVNQQLTPLVEAGNNVTVILSGVGKTNARNTNPQSENFIHIEMPQTPAYFSFIPSVIAGQVLSYEIALALDTRKHYFRNIILKREAGLNATDDWAALEKAIRKKEFVQGFNERQLQGLVDQLETESKNPGQLDKKLHYLFQYSRRTIDTVKHQAKTITVGAVRNSEKAFAISTPEQSKAKNISTSNKQNTYFDLLKATPQIEVIETLSKFTEILIYAPNLDEAFSYYIVNLINEAAKKKNSPIFARIARPYDMVNAGASTNYFWVKLSKTDNLTSNFIPSPDREKIHVTFCFDDWSGPSNPILERYSLLSHNEHFLDGVWSFHVASFLSEKLTGAFEGKADATETFLGNSMEQDFTSLHIATKELLTSKQIAQAVFQASQIFKSRFSWKSVGSGTNYNLAKFASRRLIEATGQSCAFDVLENHKHIDMSAESAILTFIANIEEPSYQNDAYSEIEKMISHKSFPIIVTNKSDNRYDDMKLDLDDPFCENGSLSLKIPVIKIPLLSEHLGFLVSLALIDMIANQVSKNFNFTKNE